MEDKQTKYGHVRALHVTFRRFIWKSIVIGQVIFFVGSSESFFISYRLDSCKIINEQMLSSILNI